jgi:hypothetical protein
MYTDSVIGRLNAKQLSIAEAAGILPVNDRNGSTGSTEEPPSANRDEIGSKLEAPPNTADDDLLLLESSTFRQREEESSAGAKEESERKKEKLRKEFFEGHPKGSAHRFLNPPKVEKEETRCNIQCSKIELVFYSVFFNYMLQKFIQTSKSSSKHQKVHPNIRKFIQT